MTETVVLILAGYDAWGYIRASAELEEQGMHLSGSTEDYAVFQKGEKRAVRGTRVIPLSGVSAQHFLEECKKMQALGFSMTGTTSKFAVFQQRGTELNAWTR